jgi:hypothetical protein
MNTWFKNCCDPLSVRQKMTRVKSSSNVLIGIIFLAILCEITLASAQRVISIKQENAFPSAYDLYQENDPWRELKIAAEQEMGLYLVEPPRRHASEITNYSNEHLHFHIWRPISESRRSIWSRGVYWLIFGRIKYSSGVRQLFSDLPSLKRITISFHEVIRPKRKGRRRSKKPDKVYTYFTVSITRADFEKVDLELIRQCGRNLDCGRDVRSMMSLVKFNSRYVKRRLR